MTALATVDLFQDLPAAATARLEAQSRVRVFRAGEPLLRQGTVSTHMYVIVRGLVHKQRFHPDTGDGSQLVELGAGESVGELGLLDGEPSHETVIAVEETAAMALSAWALAETLLLYPVLAIGLLSSVSHRLRTLDDLEGRLHELLRQTPSAAT